MAGQQEQNDGAHPVLELPLSSKYPDLVTKFKARAWHAGGNGDLTEVKQVVADLGKGSEPGAGQISASEIKQQAFKAASKHGQVSVIDYLHEEGCQATSDDVLSAIRANHFSTVKAMLAQGIDLDEPLYLNAAASKKPIWDLLIEGGANVNAGAEDRRQYSNFPKGLGVCYNGFRSATPIESASLYGTLAMVKQLVDLGANVHFGNALHHAAVSSGFNGNSDESLAIIEYLVSQGCDVNEHDDIDFRHSYGRPLHWAVHARDSQKSIELLLKLGADPAGRNGLFITPLDVAETEHTISPELVKLLGNNKSDPPPLDRSRQYLYAMNEFKPISYSDDDDDLPWKKED